MDKLKLNSKVAIVVGAAGGIGSAIAVTLSSRGCYLCLTDLQSLDDTKDKCIHAGLTEKNICSVIGDITHATVRKQVVEETSRKFGKIDILVYAAGVLVLDDLVSLTEDSLNRAMSINLNAFIFLSQLCIPHLIQSKGNIVGVSSGGALSPIPKFLSYNMSKVGMDMFIRYAGQELAKTGVRVNGVRPGLTETPMAFVNAHFFTDDTSNREKYLAQRAKAISTGRLGQPEEIAEAVAFLASEAASYITGEFITAMGGGVDKGFGAMQPNFDLLKYQSTH